MSSPKLKQAAEDIKRILEKYDIAAAVALHTPGHGEFFQRINPSYSCAYMYEDNQVRFWSKLKEFDGDKNKQRKGQADTANMLNILTTLTGQQFMMLEPLSKLMDETTNAEHGKGNYTEHKD